MGTCFSCEEEQQHQQPKDEPLKNLPGNGTAISPSKTNSTVSKMPNTAESQEIQGAGVISVTPKNVRDLRQNPGYILVDIFTYEEMRMATKHFRPDQVLGEGGFGIVYKGVINENVRPGYKTTLVAIKELDHEGFQGDREWLDFRTKEKELQAKEAELICFALLLFFVKRFGHCLVFQMQVQIESRPQKKHPLRVVDDSNKGSARYFDYLFYIDFEASMAEPRAQYALGHLQDVYMYFRGSGKAAEIKREAAKWTMMAALP